MLSTRSGRWFSSKWMASRPSSFAFPRSKIYPDSSKSVRLLYFSSRMTISLLLMTVWRVASLRFSAHSSRSNSEDRDSLAYGVSCWLLSSSTSISCSNYVVFSLLSWLSIAWLYNRKLYKSFLVYDSMRSLIVKRINIVPIISFCARSRLPLSRICAVLSACSLISRRPSRSGF